MAKQNGKRKFTSLTLRDALGLFQRRDFMDWELNAPPLPPSPVWPEILRRLDSFGISGSEAGKITLIDAILGEVLPRHHEIKAWKTQPLATDTLNGVADYLITSRGAYRESPLLCAVEAKRDDFEAGEVQCVAEMYACQWLNIKEGLAPEIYGIVSNGTAWQFYRADAAGEVYRSSVFGNADLPELFGALDMVCAACAALVGGK